VPEWTSRPRILVTNDDGVESRGLLALKQALEEMGDVTVVAPDTNQSAVGHQKTLMRPLRVRERTLEDGSLAYSVDGSPTDAVSLGLPRLLRTRIRPRRVGHQLRREPGRRHHLFGHRQRSHGGVINSCPAFAISQEYYEHPDFTLAGYAATVVARNILDDGLSRGELINVNVPAVRPRSARASRSPGSAGGSTRRARRAARPAGIPYFWIGGPPPSGLAVPGTDFHAVVNRRIAVTPIHLDLTGRRLLRRLKTWQWELAPRSAGKASEVTRRREERGPP
jgi:5'-nucleotidase